MQDKCQLYFFLNSWQNSLRKSPGFAMFFLTRDIWSAPSSSSYGTVQIFCSSLLTVVLLLIYPLHSACLQFLISTMDGKSPSLVLILTIWNFFHFLIHLASGLLILLTFSRNQVMSTFIFPVVSLASASLISAPNFIISFYLVASGFAPRSLNHKVCLLRCWHKIFLVLMG